MSDRGDRGRGALANPTEGPTWPKGTDSGSGPTAGASSDDDPSGPLPYLRRPASPERKVTLRDLAAPAPNKKPTLPYADRLPPSDPPPPPDAFEALTGADDETTALRLTADAETEDITRLRLSEPVPFYIERDSVPAPAPDPFDDAPTRAMTPADEATTQIKPNQRPSAMNLAKLASPRFAVAGEPVRIATAKPSAMRLNRVDAFLELPVDATTDAPVETPGSTPRPSLSGQRLHRALPILTGLSFIAIGAATTVIVMRNSASNGAPPSNIPEATVAAPKPAQVPNATAKKSSPAPVAAAPTSAMSPSSPIPSASTPASSGTKKTRAQPLHSSRRPAHAPSTKARPTPTGIPDESPF